MAPFHAHLSVADEGVSILNLGARTGVLVNDALLDHPIDQGSRARKKLTGLIRVLVGDHLAEILDIAAQPRTIGTVAEPEFLVLTDAFLRRTTISQ